MSVIHDLCGGIVKRLTTLGLQTERNMLPGLSEEKIRTLTAGLPFTLPRSVIELYTWSEGLKPSRGIGNDFFPGYTMDSLPEMVGSYNELSDVSREYPRFRVGDRRWFPVFRSSGTDFHGVCCGTAPAEDGEVVNDDNEGEHRDGVTPPLIEFVSLEAMLRTLLQCYETGVYYLDEQGRLEVGLATYHDDGPYKGRLKSVDMSRFEEVARRFNPGLPCWGSVRR